ncbi:MAG: DUF3127 domain-containing protein [Lacibacter sp.]
MQITATLRQLLPLQTGTGKNGTWKKQDIIVETEGNFPKKICISIWGDKIDAQKLQPGNKLVIDFDIESREYNGRWYTDVKAWRIEPAHDGSGTETVDPFPPPPVDNEPLPF